MIIGLYIGGSRIDMFKDEDVKLTDSILNISDISKNTTSYTRSFTVPASDNNNKIFKHYYNTNIDGGFDARTKVDGNIKLDGLTFKRGNLRLSEVKIKSGVPSSYTLTFWGKLIDLKKLLKNDKLKDLDFSALEYAYNSTNVKLGLETGLFDSDIIYNLLVKKQYYYNSNSSDNTNTDTLTNIAANGGSNAINVSDLSPSMRVFRIIEQIETDYNIVFSRDFFGRDEFKQLYLYLNSTKGNEKTFVQDVEFDGGDTTWVDLSTNTGTFEIEYTDFDNRNIFGNNLRIIPSTGFLNVPYTLTTFANGDVYQVQTFTGVADSVIFSNSIVDIFNSSSYTLSYKVSTTSAFDYVVEFRNTNFLTVGGSTTATTRITTGSLSSILANITPSLYMPDIKIIDFLKGLFNAFKLVVTTLEDGTIYVNDVNSYYDEGDLIDLNKYIDFENVTVSRGQLFNEISYVFEEPKTILNKKFEENTGLPYGDEETFLKDEDGDLIDGKSQKIKLPFEQILYERLPDLNDGFSSNIMYGAIIDEEINAVKIKPHIFYNVNQEIGSKKIAFKNDGGVVETDILNINTASYTNTLTNQLYGFLFSEEFNTWDGSIISKNLYTNYHKTYIDNTFNIKRRDFSYSAVLPPNIIYKLSLNDVLKIGKDYFRVSSYDLSLTNGKTNFKLLNAFDFNLRKLTPNNLLFYINNVAQNVTTYVTNGVGKEFTFSYEDVGFGTDWITTVQSGANIINTVTENTSGVTREVFVIVSLNAVEQFRIYINQSSTLITVDNNIITVDNNLITADNG